MVVDWRQTRGDIKTPGMIPGSTTHHPLVVRRWSLPARTMMLAPWLLVIITWRVVSSRRAAPSPPPSIIGNGLTLFGPATAASARLLASRGLNGHHQTSCRNTVLAYLFHNYVLENRQNPASYHVRAVHPKSPSTLIHASPSMARSHPIITASKRHPMALTVQSTLSLAPASTARSIRYARPM